MRPGVAIEKFGYGIGFTACLLCMIRISRGEHQTSHHAIPLEAEFGKRQQG